MPNSNRVLYVDDDSNSLEVRAMMLEEYDLDVLTETNVADAKRRIAEDDIDCVLSDLDMPDQDGFDLLEYVQDVAPHLAFILFTSHESEEVIDRAMESGATDYFPKSMTNVSYGLLAHRIRQAIRVTAAEYASDSEPEETDQESRVGVPQTEIDPGSGKSTADIGGWKPVEKQNAKTTPAEPATSPTSTSQASEPEIDVATSEALTWLDGEEKSPESTARVDETASEPQDGGRGQTIEADEFIYPAAEETDGVASQAAAIEKISPSEIQIVESTPDGSADVTAASDTGEGSPETGSASRSPVPAVSPLNTSDETETGATETDETELEAPEAGDVAPEPSGATGQGARNQVTGDEQSIGAEPGLGAKINLEADPTAPDTSEERPADESTVPNPGPPSVESTEVEIDTEGSQITETLSASETGAEAAVSEGPSTPNEDIETGAHDHDTVFLDGFEPQPGDGILVECGSLDDRRNHACVDLLGLDEVEGRNVLLIRYRQMQTDRLQRIAEDAAEVHLISIGYRQSVPDEINDLVKTTRINDPSELTRLGIVMTRVIGNWDEESLDTVVCLDSLDILMGYTDNRSVFRFLHILLSKLQSYDAISHFHIEPSQGYDGGADTLKPLFDSIITIDDEGVYIE